jgi:hypothetical protein
MELRFRRRYLGRRIEEAPMRAGDWFGFGMILAVLLTNLLGAAGRVVLLLAFVLRTLMMERERKRHA